jgi:hypothetical protein
MLVMIHFQFRSMSFALLTEWGAFLGLTLFYWLVDVKKWWEGFLFELLGPVCR